MLPAAADCAPSARVHPEIVGGFVRVAAGYQPAAQQTASLRYVVAPIVNRLWRRLAACVPPTTAECNPIGTRSNLRG
jgi:hypothetical protein